MNFLRAGGLTLIIVFACAALLRILYPPIPRDIKFLAPVSGDLEIGNVASDNRLPHFKTAWVQALGVADETAATVETVRAYVDALQRTSDKVDLVISASASIDHAISGVQHFAISIVRLSPANIFQALHDAHAKNLKVLLILSSVDATHRLPQTLTIYLEDQFTTKIPVTIFAGLALTEDQEKFLVPACEGNPYAEQGQVFDLAQNILIMSKRAQVERPSLDHYLVSIEEESDDEELVAIYRPPR